MGAAGGRVRALGNGPVQRGRVPQDSRPTKSAADPAATAATAAPYADTKAAAAAAELPVPTAGPWAWHCVGH